MERFRLRQGLKDKLITFQDKYLTQQLLLSRLGTSTLLGRIFEKTGALLTTAYLESVRNQAHRSAEEVKPHRQDLILGIDFIAREGSVARYGEPDYIPRLNILTPFPALFTLTAVREMIHVLKTPGDDVGKLEQDLLDTLSIYHRHLGDLFSAVETDEWVIRFRIQYQNKKSHYPVRVNFFINPKLSQKDRDFINDHYRQQEIEALREYLGTAQKVNRLVISPERREITHYARPLQEKDSAYTYLRVTDYPLVFGSDDWNEIQPEQRPVLAQQYAYTDEPEVRYVFKPKDPSLDWILVIREIQASGVSIRQIIELVYSQASVHEAEAAYFQRKIIPWVQEHQPQLAGALIEIRNGLGTGHFAKKRAELESKLFKRLLQEFIDQGGLSATKTSQEG